MPGVKNQARLKSFMTELTAYRTVDTADGSVDPDVPPPVAQVDLSNTHHGLNTVQVFATPSGSASPDLELWVIVDNKWFFVARKTIDVGQPEVWTVTDVPGGKIAVVVSSMGGSGIVVLELSVAN
jgi:hypothetical protein